MELLIVMVILGLLIALATGNFASSIKKGRDSRRKGDLKHIATALESYYSDKGKYPTGNSNGEIVGCRVNDAQVCPWGSDMTDKNGTLYMVLLPKDPTSSRQYYYSSVTGASYQLYARLENTLDADVPQSGSTSQAYSSTNCSGSILCNYGVSSTNTTPVAGRTLVDQ